MFPTPRMLPVTTGAMQRLPPLSQPKIAAFQQVLWFLMARFSMPGGGGYDIPLPSAAALRPVWGGCCNTQGAGTFIYPCTQETEVLRVAILFTGCVNGSRGSSTRCFLIVSLPDGRGWDTHIPPPKMPGWLELGCRGRCAPIPGIRAMQGA